MQTQEFVGQVQHKAHLSSLDDALRATRATLQTLAERLGADEARHLSAQLPQEIQRYLDQPAAAPERFSSDVFLDRVSKREGIDLPVSVHHARAVLDVLQQAVSAGEVQNVLDRLPEDYQRLFAGSEGKIPRH
jgi:uncharacterized protein (DUF2267 family)